MRLVAQPDVDGGEGGGLGHVHEALSRKLEEGQKVHHDRGNSSPLAKGLQEEVLELNKLMFF